MEYAYGIIPCRRSARGWEVLLVFDRHGNWGFPKGHLEEGESALAGAQRELLEETGLKVKRWLPSPELITNYTYNGISKEVGYFLALVKGRARKAPPEVTSVKWLTLDQALATATFLETQELIPLIRYALDQAGS